jgi:hypothetical protein
MKKGISDKSPHRDNSILHSTAVTVVTKVRCQNFNWYTVKDLDILKGSISEYWLQEVLIS